MTRCSVALLLAIALATPPAQASDLSQAVVKTESGHMTCPPPPQSCTTMVAMMSVAAVASVVFLYALSRDR